ncbi:piezo-type mechanosensitive ion channel homolog isoform X1 [Macadamia integrifolia]|uniref:piezo-type mechanosensitive ion channel homolog isoform X1 n=1 Tax=Macadamia integrifolia TaxID=60698 RepID=UPI001C52B8C0|nr:piezo-type mechanosensitive ion channel homolog isoform X1 [Macadamia integrifolia]
MRNFLGEFVLPLLLLTAALLNWSLISLVDLLVFLVILFSAPKIGFHFWRQSWVPWFIIFFSLLAILPQVIFYIIWAVEGDDWSVIDSWWAKLLGYVRVQPSRSPSVIYYLVVQLLTAIVALVEIYGSRFFLIPWQDSSWGRFLSCMDHLGTHLRVACCLLLPAIQLVVGISRPSWASLPFFICSCVGLVDWSLTSNFLGLFRWWRPLLLYAGFNIGLLYVYQLPIVLPKTFQMVADFIGFYKISSISEWTEICSGLSLLVFYYMLSFVKCDLEEMDVLMSMRESNLTEQLLPSRHSFFVHESRSGVRHTNVLLRGAVFRTFSINFFTYGFPVSLLALSFWSFHFASLCAFGLLAYVGYILYAFPSLFRLHRLHGLVLVFILLWAASTYVFNVAFVFLNKKLRNDMEIWETVGLWHYPIPGFFLLAQFFLGILVAMGNLVNNSVFLYLSEADGQSLNDDHLVEEKEETKVLIVATIAWGLRKSSRAITLALIFLLATKPGFIHAIYMVFFLVYLLNHTVSREVRQSLILLCEAHFALLYILQLNLISNALEQKGSFTMEVLSQLGLMDHATSWDFLEIAVLACFCAVHNHGFEMLVSFSAIVQHTPCPPFGFSILSAGLNKSVLLSVYASSVAGECQSNNPSYERRIATYLSAIGQKFLSAYRSCGTYIAFLTILIAVYLVTPNYISFGYLFFLLLWIVGRQLVEETRKRLWFPLKVYSLIVFIFIYSLSIFSSFETWLSGIMNLYPDLGYNPDASLLENVWESLAVLIVMELYSYERRQSRHNGLDDSHQLEHGTLNFFRRLLIWHSDKILYLSLFYALLSPISAFGFLYLLGLVICSTLPKGSRVPSKLFLVYAGLLVITEYLFQMWGKLAEMFPGQRHSALSFFLGFQLFKPGFWGLESGLRGEVLVIVACTLQYNVFHWLERMPSAFVNAGKWEEPCPLFVSKEDEPIGTSVYVEESKPSSRTSLPSLKQRVTTSNSWPSFSSGMHHGPAPETEPQGSGIRKYSFEYIWGCSRESNKWNKKRILSLRRERFDMQKATLKIYLKFWTENLFNLLGLEINMIALLLASFAVLNAISVLYIASLAACVLLDRRVIRKLWPMFVFSSATVLTLEYLAMWKNLVSWNEHVPSETKVHCHDCWSSSNLHFNYCKDCWLGFVVDDPRMLISYYVVFMLACFKLRSDHLSGYSGSQSYHQMISQRSNASVWRDLSFETKSLWTILDYLRLYCYCHLLDLVLALILITGTLQYDILHLGYLGFALLFFRLRLEILKKKNKIFKFLRMYNFSLIVLSLAYQSPFLGDFSAGKCETLDYIYEVIGFYKYDYGFRITSRSALVEIIIFMLVTLQSYMFSSLEFDYVSRYLEAEQIGALVHEQEKKAAWKTAQLQHIRKCEEQKCQRNLQVEKMKSEMLNLQIQLHTMNSTANYENACSESEGLRRRRTTSLSSNRGSATPDKDESIRRQDLDNSTDSLFHVEMHDSSRSIKTESPSAAEFAHNSMDSPPCEITELEEKSARTAFLNSGGREKGKGPEKDNPLKSAVQLIGDGVSQVQSLGNQAVTNLVSFLNIDQEDLDSNDHYSSAEDSLYDEIESQNVRYERLDRITSVQSGFEKTMPEAASLQIGRIFRYIWSQIHSNNDLVCYCCFIVVFLWNFSFLSMVYLAALFLYALCISTGPSYIFWVIMLIYTEVYILLQYLYQIIIQHCGLTIQWNLLQELGFPVKKNTSSFVVSTLPLFLVYLFTLLQSSITAKDSEWVSVTELKSLKWRILHQEEVLVSSGWKGRVQRLLLPVKNVMRMVIRSLCRYWKSLTQGTESPPYFVQLSMEVKLWPEDGIQPESVESGINKLLKNVHDERCEEKNPDTCHSASRVRVQSIERSQENPNIALAVFEVVYASPLTECHPKEWYKSLTPASDVAKEIITAQRQGLVEGIGFPYPILSVIGGGKREIDLYAYIFGADLAVFFLVAIFYQSVIKNNSQFLEVYQLEDQFPKEFVFILMILFFLIVLDRIIYLCSFATGKVLFYLSNLILFTYSVTEYAWYMEPSHRRAGGLALRAIYFTKAVSLALQAIQIRYGIAHKSTLYRQFLTSKVSQVYYLGFRLYRALPFLYELRCVLDWSCTTTSLTMYDWLKLEDIHSSLYLVKCDADLNRAKHQQGQKQTKMTKFCNGICLFLILICVIWAPMLMYSSGNPTNIANPIKDASVQIDIKTAGGRLTLYQTTLCERLPWDNLHVDVNLDPQGYLDSYDVNDIQLICCQDDASTLWLVPSVVQAKFVQSLDLYMDITFSWVFTRDRPKGKEVVKHEFSVPKEDLPNPSEIKEVLNGITDSFRISNVYPKYLRVTGSAEVRNLEQINESVSGDLFVNSGSPKWWSFHDIDASELNGCGGLRGPMAVIVSEEIPQGILGETLSKFSIWGLYITFVLAVGRFIRIQCSNLRMRIPFENLPSCERLLAICEDIYAARAEGELEVEEVLYWTLVKIYRSPHMLLEYTKPD